MHLDALSSVLGHCCGLLTLCGFSHRLELFIRIAFQQDFGYLSKHGSGLVLLVEHFSQSMLESDFTGRAEDESILRGKDDSIVSREDFRFERSQWFTVDSDLRCE